MAKEEKLFRGEDYFVIQGKSGRSRQRKRGGKETVSHSVARVSMSALRCSCGRFTSSPFDPQSTREEVAVMDELRAHRKSRHHKP